MCTTVFIVFVTRVSKHDLLYLNLLQTWSPQDTLALRSKDRNPVGAQANTSQNLVVQHFWPNDHLNSYRDYDRQSTNQSCFGRIKLTLKQGKFFLVISPKLCNSTKRYILE